MVLTRFLKNTCYRIQRYKGSKVQTWSFAKACRAINFKARNKFLEINFSGRKTLCYSTISYYCWIATILVIFISYGKICSIKYNIWNVRCYIQCSLESMLATTHITWWMASHSKRFRGKMKFVSWIFCIRWKAHPDSMCIGHWNPILQLQGIF